MKPDRLATRAHAQGMNGRGQGKGLKGRAGAARGFFQAVHLETQREPRVPVPLQTYIFIKVILLSEVQGYYTTYFQVSKYEIIL